MRAHAGMGRARKQPAGSPVDAVWREEPCAMPDVALDGDGETAARCQTLPSTCFVDKYAPRTLEEVAGNDDAKNELMECIASRVHGPIACHGPPGVGKLTCVRLALQAHAIEHMTFHMALNTLEEVRQHCRPTCNVMQALHGLETYMAVVCTDLEVLSKPDRGRLLDILSSVAESYMCIVVCQGRIEKLFNVEFGPVGNDDIDRHLAWIAAEEAIPFVETQSSMGDVRAAVNVLQAGACASVYRRMPPDPYVRALHAFEELRPVSGELSDAVRLVDAMSCVDAARPFYNREYLMHAAGMTAAGGFHMARSSSVNARHAQLAGRSHKVREVASATGVAVRDVYCAARIARACTLDGERGFSAELLRLGATQKVTRHIASALKMSAVTARA